MPHREGEPVLPGVSGAGGFLRTSARCLPGYGALGRGVGLITAVENAFCRTGPPKRSARLGS